MFFRAAARCRPEVVRFGRTVLRPPRGPRFVCAARKDVVRFATASSRETSIPYRFAAARIFLRAVSFALSDGNSVWLNRAIAFRTCDSSWIGR